MSAWSLADIPDCSDRIFVVTGANSGLGFETVKALARRGAKVVMACRDTVKANDRAIILQDLHPNSGIDVEHVDLASLRSIAEFAVRIRLKYNRLDGLINNAGVMATPYRLTEDKFELQFGTNHLGHFALTAHLMPLLEKGPASRIVTLTSNAHRFGRIDFDDPQHVRRYAAWLAYGQSKLANLLFSLELQRRLTQHSCRTISVAAHPGYAATDLQLVGPRMRRSQIMEWFMKLANRLFAQSVESGARTILYAATRHDVVGGSLYGPRFLSLWGEPRLEIPSRRAADQRTARRLWSMSESLTHIQFL